LHTLTGAYKNTLLAKSTKKQKGLSMKREILELNGDCRDYLWGGNRLREEYGKVSDKEIIAESWELSARDDSLCMIKNSSYKGRNFLDYFKETQSESMGTLYRNDGIFPVLIKLIDAKQDLSIQVHPSDEYAFKTEGEPGKTEMWYVIDAVPGSRLVYGFNSEISKEDFKNSIEDNTFIDKLKFVEVKKGDVFFIPSGTIHAIGAGVLIAEIQQNSNITYRVYDYDRRDKNGNTRQLHVKKALDVTALTVAPPQKIFKTIENTGYTSRKLAECKYFSAEKINITAKSADFFADEKSFHHILVLSGTGVIKNEKSGESIEITKGSSIFIPSLYGNYTIEGNIEFIRTFME
jgi:mannose-6-phosphate isomerase